MINETHLKGDLIDAEVPRQEGGKAGLGFIGLLQLSLELVEPLEFGRK